jgi:hypothetical protein
VSLSAAQLIYTNVEKKLSSRGRDGYQVWLRTPGLLSEAEETEIQSRVGDFEDRRDATASDGLARHMFFSLSTGRAFISRTVPLAETDKFNRSGRFYAHAFVVEPADFAQVGNDPFAILEQAKFQSSLDEGLRAGDAGKGTIPAAQFEKRPANGAKRAIASEQMLGLIPALLRAASAGDKRLMIGVPGAPAQVMNLVRELFGWLPPTLRRACSFDTLSSGRNLTQIPFAIAGLPSAGPPRRYVNLLLLDLSKHSLSQPVPSQAAATFDQWLLQHVRQNAEAPPSNQAEAAYRLGTCLDNGAVPSADLSIVDGSIFQQLACGDAGIPKLERVLRARLRADVGQALEPLIFALAWSWMQSTGLEGLRALSQPLSHDLVLRWLLAVYEQRTGDEINREAEVPSLKDVLEQTKSVEGDSVAARKKLVLILYRWGRRWSNLARSVRDVKMIPDEIYQWFVEWAFRNQPARIEMGAGASHRGAWCGPEIVAQDPKAAEESSKLFGAMLGIDSPGSGDSGEIETGRTSLPPERWEWLLFHLLNQVHRNGRS